MIDCDLVEPGIFVGSSPQSDEDVQRLTQLKVTAVINLQSDDDLRARNIQWTELSDLYVKSNIVAERFPINDFDENDLGRKIAAPIRRLNGFRLEKHKVYVHCNSGVCRAPAAVLGYLCHYQSMSLEEGLRQLRIARPVVNPYRSAVARALEELVKG